MNGIGQLFFQVFQDTWEPSVCTSVRRTEEQPNQRGAACSIRGRLLLQLRTGTIQWTGLVNRASWEGEAWHGLHHTYGRSSTDNLLEEGRHSWWDEWRRRSDRMRWQWDWRHAWKRSRDGQPGSKGSGSCFHSGRKQRGQRRTRRCPYDIMVPVINSPDLGQKFLAWSPVLEPPSSGREAVTVLGKITFHMN